MISYFSIDLYLTSKEAFRKRESNAEKVCRHWFVSLNEWLGRHYSNHLLDKSSSSSSNLGKKEQEQEVFVLPADEFFPRCPVSKEVFDTFWDEDGGVINYYYYYHLFLLFTFHYYKFRNFYSVMLLKY